MGPDDLASGTGTRTDSCAGATARGRVTIMGRVRSILVQPKGSAPSLEAVLDDGTGTVRVIWLGRRRIAGIEPGRIVKINGFVSRIEATPTVFNPRYELRATSRESND